MESIPMSNCIYEKLLELQNLLKKESSLKYLCK